MKRVKIPQAPLENIQLRLLRKPDSFALLEMGIGERTECGFTDLLYHRTLGFSGSTYLWRLKSGCKSLLVGRTLPCGTGSCL